jgi:hypothetical protein
MQRKQAAEGKASFEGIQQVNIGLRQGIHSVNKAYE